MTTIRKPLSLLFALLPVALVSAAACGGKSFSAGDGAGGLGSAGAAGAGVSGSATAGSSVGGSATAGSSVGGSATAGSSVGGSANAGASTGGAATGGTANGGGSGGVNLYTCAQNTDCVIEPTNCCSCGTGPVTDYTAINSKYVAQYNPNCGAVDCAACPPTAANPNAPKLYYVPTCATVPAGGDLVVHECRVVDLRRPPSTITTCKVDTDCTLRGGTGCCQGCGTQAVAINAKKENELDALVCPTVAFGCAECAPNTSGLAAQCKSGQCSVAFGSCPPDVPCL